MAYQIVEKRFPSADGSHELYGKVYVPNGEIRGLFQIVHGMGEHIGRYDAFMRFLAEQGLVVFGEDHLGHGQSACDDELGFFAHRDGARILVEDSHTFGMQLKAEYPGKRFVLMGHSMGSFMARLYAARFGEDIDSLIIMGTGGKNAKASAGIAMAKVVRFFRGEKHFSKLLYFLAFGHYNDRTEKLTYSDWITTDRSIIERDAADPRCNFGLTVSGMIDLVTMNKLCNVREWYQAMRKDLPILIVSGTEDPVGDYGKGPREVAKLLEEAGAAPITLHLYEGARHEILNDFCRDEATADIFAWLKGPAGIEFES